MDIKSLSKFDLMKKTFDLVVKQERLTKLNVKFYEDNKFEYPFFMRKDKAQTMVFKFEEVRVVVVNPEASVVFMLDGDCELINRWLECIDCKKINPDHFVDRFKKVNEPKMDGLVNGAERVLYVKFVMIVCEEKLKPEVDIEDLEYDPDNDDDLGDNCYYVEKRPVFWVTKFISQKTILSSTSTSS